ncbi:stage VI sporulation protein F [Bacillus taeanensis]|uniref:Stage VI sporulation protein F n=1 Tax=Bacillus taeanensis TaxID=273032 RepID=A0A366XVI6_9BACI|nr:stage VI sporulation protein F [Bacillus taeanensis]RBW70400.1 stage VI sporulation protein F [Bacillus taeanensis]
MSGGGLKVSNQNSFFDNIEKKTNVKKEDLFKLADSVKDANFKDEKTIRKLISQVSRLANVPVSKEKEDKIVKAIMNNNMPIDFASISKMFDKK